MADIGRGPIGKVVERYDQKLATWRESIDNNKAPWRDQAGHVQESPRDFAINETNGRLAPLAYSLDIAWQVRPRQVIDRMIERRRGYTIEMLNEISSRFESTMLTQRLKDWSLAADPFKEEPDKAAIASRGEKLLEAIDSCYNIAVVYGETYELLPDLVAIAQRVRGRMNNIEGGLRPKSAVSVPHQMYLELKGNVAQSRAFAEQIVLTVALLDGKSVEEAAAYYQEVFDYASSYFPQSRLAKEPYSCWEEAVELTFESSSAQPYKNDLAKLFGSQDFESQLTILGNTIKNKKAKDYVVRVRDAAWDVQTTLDRYLRGINDVWRPKGRDDGLGRDVVIGTLILLQDRLLKDVDLIVLEQFADPSRRHAIDEGDDG